MQKFTPCLWFESKAEEAAHFYVSICHEEGWAGALRNLARQFSGNDSRE